MTWQPPQYGVRGRELNWLQGTLQHHDSFCGCPDPVSHFIKTALKHGGVMQFNEDKLQQLAKCHLTTAAPHGEPGKENERTGAADDQLNIGDLEKLFEEDTDFTEEDDG